MNNEIEILSETEAVRRNPWMYIGSIGRDGTHQLLCEIVHNAVDEALIGQGTRISVTFSDGACTVEDDGRGLPTEIHPQAGIPAAEVALTKLHAGSKFNRDRANFSAGLHGVGLSCVNALSSELEVHIDREGRKFHQRFKRGLPVHPLRELGATDGRGTKLTFLPDQTIFTAGHEFDLQRSRAMIEDLAFLHPQLSFHFNHEPLDGASGLGGLYGKYLVDKRALLPEPVRIHGEGNGIAFEILANWTTESEPEYVSFVNGVRTTRGGSHVNAFRTGLTRAVNKMLADWKEEAEADEATEGLFAVVNARIQRPNFEGQTKSTLTNEEVIADIEHATCHQIAEYLKQNPKAAATIFERINETRRARAAAKRAADRVYYQHRFRGIDEEVYKAQFGARSKNWHDSAVWITHEELLKSHAALTQVSEDSIALDVCCGSGVVGASFKGRVKKVIGLDLTPEMVALAKTRLDEVVQANVYNIPFPDNTFDLVCTREVLHLLPYPERPVSEIYRVLKPGGQFIVGQILPFCESDAAWMYRVFKKKQPLIFNMFQEEDFRRLLLTPGFTDLEMTEMNVWESIDVWIDSVETTAIHRHEIRELFRNCPPEAKAHHPFKIAPDGTISDLWRWCMFSVRKPK